MYKIIGVDGKEYGPVSAQDIVQWISEGRLNGATKAQAEGSSDWKSLHEFPEFAAVLGRAVPPPAALGLPPVPPPPGPAFVDPKAEAEKIIARGLDFSIGDCLSKGWELVKADFWPVVGASAIILLILSAAGALLYGPAVGGLFYFFLRKIRHQPVTFNDVFSGFSMAFLQLFLVYLVASLLGTVGFFLCVIPGIYLFIAWYFAIPLVMDRRMEFWPAMEVSRLVVNKIWWKVFALYLVLLLITIVGLCLCFVGTFITFPITMAAAAYAYESIFNRPAQPAP